jgi:hypothetical protein
VPLERGLAFRRWSIGLDRDRELDVRRQRGRQENLTTAVGVECASAPFAGGSLTTTSAGRGSASSGGGGIGCILKPRVDLGELGEVGTLVLLIAVAVRVMDPVSAGIRERIV